MGKKYIIELEEPEMFDERKFYTCTQIPWWALSEDIVENLTPYTEPDLEQVKKEAYEQGRKDGKIEGQAETWVCVKKIAFNPESVECVDDLVRMGFDVGDGNGWSEAIEELFEKYTATQAIEKIQQYEQEKENIQVGNEVKSGDEKYIVLQKYLNNIDELMVVLFNRRNGEIDKWHLYNGNGVIFEKTGGHFPEIATVFAKMRKK